MLNANTKMMAIVGSRATMLYYNDLRTAGAQVRKVLLPKDYLRLWPVAVACQFVVVSAAAPGSRAGPW